MTVPPQGSYGSQPPGGGGPQWGGPPPQGPGAQPPHGGPGQPQYGQQPGGGTWPQQGWTGAPPPPNNGGKGKWILIGLALVAIIAVSIVGTVLVLRPDSGAGNGSSNTADGASEFASANDTGPANIITEDPTCEAWRKISHDMDSVSNAIKWNQQDYAVPATEWTSEQRAAFDKKGAALADALKNVANIAKQTPHRVMRELYGQYTAYSQAVINAIPAYSSTDGNIVAASNKFFGVLNHVCDATYYRAAQQASPLIAEPAPPSAPQAPNSDRGPAEERFLKTNNGSCGDWVAMAERFNTESTAWRDLDPNIRATEWAPEQKAVVDAVIPVLKRYADDMEDIGRQSNNPVWEDFAVLAAQYMRAYVQVAPTYTSSYGLLSLASTNLSVAINWACKAAS